MKRSQSVTMDDVLNLLKSRPSDNGIMGFALLLVGIILTPVTLAGALWGYVRAYNRYHSEEMEPSLSNQTPITKVSMVLFAILIWFILAVVIWLATLFYKEILPRAFMDMLGAFGILLLIALNFVVFFTFERWRLRASLVYQESGRHGSSKFSKEADLSEYKTGRGIHIGNGLSYKGNFHMITVAGTRSGKFTSLIGPALLDDTAYQGSWVIIDPKGELAHVTSRYQREKGQQVVILDPWGQHPLGTDTYNPLDLLQHGEDLEDDAAMIAEMIVPISPNSNDKFWDQRAQSIVTGLIIYIFLVEEEKTLTHLWYYARQAPDDWLGMVAKMATHPHPLIRATGNEIMSVTVSPETYASIMANVINATDFLKSPALQKTLVSSGFDINRLSEGKTTVYVIIPPDKLDTQFKWLRLVISTTLKAVVRTKKNRVTFILDEFASLGKLDIIANQGPSAYAGYNITLWPILQSLPQLQNLYKDNWQNFMANTAVKHFFGIGDNFTAEYLSKSLGTKTILTYDDKENIKTSQRPLADISEIIKMSGESMFITIDKNPTALFKKRHYYEIPALKGRYDENPHYKA